MLRLQEKVFVNVSPGCTARNGLMQPTSSIVQEPPRKVARHTQAERDDSDGEVEGAGTVVQDFHVRNWAMTENMIAVAKSMPRESHHRLIWSSLDLTVNNTLDACLHTIQVCKDIGDLTYVGCSSNPTWRMFTCKSAGMKPHEKRFRWLLPTACGPAEFIRLAERMAIEELCVQGYSHLNIGRGGERVGSGYMCFLYCATNQVPSGATYEHNGLMRCLSPSHF